ncbi:MAG: hypothetical protein AABW81_02870 [Nanoarchaeota archaeon]
MGNKGQVTIFIIIAILIVALVTGIFIYKNNTVSSNIPTSIEPVYTSFLSCLNDKTKVGIDILESQGGYIYLPDFEPGSTYSPFSSQLVFLGNPIPYWYYVSGNNIQKEQVPSKRVIEKQLGDFIDEKIRECNFDSYYENGFEINNGEPEAKVTINNQAVDVVLSMDMTIIKGEESVNIKEHKIEVKSNFGKLYDSALKVYNYEQSTLFLENYLVDILRNYAPVDGVEMTCSPKMWNADEVFSELQDAIEANTLALTTDKNTKNKENKYFVVDLPVDESVKFINSKNWPYSFEVNPSEESVMISKPVGNQPGLGILGFCYVPYHFVYNVKYPVLVQVYSGSEIFQFPVAVVLQGNKPRKSLDTSTFESPETGLCEYKNTIVSVKTYDSKLKPIDADISYECFNEFCTIGKTNSGILSGEFPQCVNGFILARADGFEDSKYQYSTTQGGVAEIILARLYDVEINLKLDGRDYNKDAIISFISDKSSKTVVYPSQKSVSLTEGQYEIMVEVYKNSSITLAGTKQEQCIDVPESGLGGILGMTEEKCFEIKIPAQIISNALGGGGREEYFMLESELSNSDVIEINAQSLATPKTIEELQNNYIIFEERELDINFR